MKPTWPDFLHLMHRPDTGQLIGRWLRNLEEDELHAGYDALREAALHCHCGHWLIDARRRTDRRRTTREWVTVEFLPNVQRELGQPMRVAFLVLPDHFREAGAGGQVGEVAFARFIEEGAAYEWLMVSG